MLLLLLLLQAASGGAVSVLSSDIVTIRRVSFVNNVANEDYGGALFLNNIGNLTIDQAIFTQNQVRICP
jgi:hypothetical protein